MTNGSCCADILHYPLPPTDLRKLRTTFVINCLQYFPYIYRYHIKYCDNVHDIKNFILAKDLLLSLAISDV